MAFEGAPLVQVAVEPLDPTALPALLRALELLDQADPAVEVAQLDTGEHVLRTCGEVHLERCLVDLRTTFAPDVRLSVSPPIVPFARASPPPPPPPSSRRSPAPPTAGAR